VVAATTLAFSGQLVYLQFHEGFPLPPFGAQGTLPSLLHVFCVFIAYYSVFFSFFPVWGLVCPGGYADLAKGSTECHLAHFVVCIFPSGLDAGVW
jgi:hypothetical protein